MKTSVLPDGTIDIAGDPDSSAMKIAVIDEIMRQISEQLGEGRRFGAVRLSGYWVIGETGGAPSHSWTPVYGHEAGQQTRRFSTALSAAFNRPVSTTSGGRAGRVAFARAAGQGSAEPTRTTPVAPHLPDRRRG
jgi:hypothetical protein